MKYICIFTLLLAPTNIHEQQYLNKLMLCMAFGHNLFLVKMSEEVRYKKQLWVKTWSKNVYCRTLRKMHKAFKYDDLTKGCG
jgi:hypothetical protein